MNICEILGQLALYLLIPALTFAFAFLFEDRLMSAIVGGAATFFIATLSSTLSLFLSKSSSKEDSDSFSCTRSLLFLFPRRSSLAEFISTSLLSLLYGAAASYMMNEQTLNMAGVFEKGEVL